MDIILLSSSKAKTNSDIIDEHIKVEKFLKAISMLRKPSNEVEEEEVEEKRN